MAHHIFLEYIWLDGTKPVVQMRSKTRILVSENKNPPLEELPDWAFDGSSTNQAAGGDSDCILKPVCKLIDPLREHGFLVLCEVYNAEGQPHVSNTRAHLRHVMDVVGNEIMPWAGFEQEYTMFAKNIPLGWPEHGYPAPQGPYYCGVGAEQIFGRAIAEAHAEACVKSGVLYYGLNAEVMPGQWEFQIGFRGCETEDASMLSVSDHLWIARWLLHRISEPHGVHISLDNKPVKGDWNGAGLHTNFSTALTRDKTKGMQHIRAYIARLEKQHEAHINVYGDRLHERLTGLHETCSINEFKAGEADRGSSIRIPRQVVERGYGYIEDRRPGANADPYLVSARLLATVCDVSLDEITKDLRKKTFSSVA